MIAKNLSKQAKTFIDILSSLSERDSFILIERFKHHKSLKEVAKYLQVTDAAIKEKEDGIISKIDKSFDFLI